jgi:hypothetical protein
VGDRGDEPKGAEADEPKKGVRDEGQTQKVRTRLRRLF